MSGYDFDQATDGVVTPLSTKDGMDIGELTYAPHSRGLYQGTDTGRLLVWTVEQDMTRYLQGVWVG